MKKKRFLVVPLWMWNVVVILGLITATSWLDFIIHAAVLAFSNLSTTFARTWPEWTWAKTWHGGKLDKRQ